MRKRLLPVIPVAAALVLSAGAGERMPAGSERTPRLQPRWFILLFWKVHRALFRVTGGRLGLWPARAQRWGAMRVTTIGRRSGQERSVILGYLEDGPNLVTLAMNGWGEAEPAWWLNLQAHPQVRVQLKADPRGRRPRRDRTGAGQAVGPVAVSGQGSRRLRESPTVTNGGGGPRTQNRTRLRQAAAARVTRWPCCTLRGRLHTSARRSCSSSSARP